MGMFSDDEREPQPMSIAEAMVARDREFEGFPVGPVPRPAAEAMVARSADPRLKPEAECAECGASYGTGTIEWLPIETVVGLAKQLRGDDFETILVWDANTKRARFWLLEPLICPSRATAHRNLTHWARINDPSQPLRVPEVHHHAHYHLPPAAEVHIVGSVVRISCPKEGTDAPA